jgi:guanylate kinase
VVTVFLLPPDCTVLEERLRLRGTDAEPTIALRLRNARAEVSRAADFDYLVVNDDLDRAWMTCWPSFAPRRNRTARYENIEATFWR